MALQTFNPSIMPSPGTSRRWKLKLLEAEFGDGYSQPVPDGLNHMRRTLDLRWGVLLDEQADEIVNFFLAHEGTTPFYYTPPRETVPVKWTCREWTDDVDEAGFRKVTAQLVQDFSLVT